MKRPGRAGHGVPAVNNAWCAALLSVLALATCDHGVAPALGVDVEVVLSEAVVSPSAPIEVRVEATNRGRQVVRISMNACPHLFEVRDASDRVVGPEPATCLAAVVPPRDLGPGETQVFEYMWSGLGSDRQVLPDGPYVIRGWIHSMGGVQRLSADVGVEVTSGAS